LIRLKAIALAAKLFSRFDPSGPFPVLDEPFMVWTLNVPLPKGVLFLDSNSGAAILRSAPGEHS
jgi:hypothetical protein